MNENYVINLGRQLGSGGKEIGESWQKNSVSPFMIKN